MSRKFVSRLISRHQGRILSVLIRVCFPYWLLHQLRSLKVSCPLECLLKISFYKTPSKIRWRNLRTAFSIRKRINVFRPHDVGEIWKRNNHRLFWICVWGKLGQGNHRIIVMSSFSKSSVFKMFFIHTKTKSRRFRKALFLWRISVDDRPNRRNKAVFSNLSSGQVWKGLSERHREVLQTSVFQEKCFLSCLRTFISFVRQIWIDFRIFN